MHVLDQKYRVLFILILLLWSSLINLFYCRLSFKEHIKMLERQYAKTIGEIKKYTAREINQENLELAVYKFSVEVAKVYLQLNVKLEKEKYGVVKTLDVTLK